jgi:hypothetical protein
VNEEQEKQTKETECEDQLRIEQAKLSELQALLEELERALEKSRPQPAGTPH